MTIGMGLWKYMAGRKPPKPEDNSFRFCYCRKLWFSCEFDTLLGTIWRRWSVGICVLRVTKNFTLALCKC